MRSMILLMTWLTFSPSAFAAKSSNDTWAWEQWRRLPVQQGGRQKPLDTLARETLQAISGRQSIQDPKTHVKLDAVAWYLSVLFAWQGWDETVNSTETASADRAMTCSLVHEPDQWDRAPTFRVEHLALRKALGIPVERIDVSARELCLASIRDSQTGEQTPLLVWASRRSSHAAGRPLSQVDEEALRLAAKLRLYQAVRSGTDFRVLPVAGDSLQAWISIDQLWHTRFDDNTDPTGTLRLAQKSLRKVQAAYANDSPTRLNRASADFISLVTRLGSELGNYPTSVRIDMEVAYNHWMPVRIAWILALSALVAICMSRVGKRPVFYSLAIATFSAAMVAALAGLGARVVISGRAPVTNMFESVIFMALGTGLLGLLLELKWRRGFILGIAAVISAAAFSLADLAPSLLDQGIRPLQPALRSNFWLVVHVLIVTLSYSAFALAMGIGNVTLGYYIVRSQQWDTIDRLNILCCRSLRAGVLLLALGTLAGAIWADYCWGRFWGWDPKEVWALITLLGYLALLHAQHVQWVGRLGLAALSVICFSLVVVAWYGVNYVLGSGLHAYGRGQGGIGYVIGFLFIQFLFVAIAAARSVGHEPNNRPCTKAGT